MALSEQSTRKEFPELELRFRKSDAPRDVRTGILSQAYEGSLFPHGILNWFLGVISKSGHLWGGGRIGTRATTCLSLRTLRMGRAGKPGNIGRQSAPLTP